MGAIRRFASLLVFVTLLVIVGPPPAMASSAAPLDAHFTVGGPALFQGSYDVSADVLGVVCDARLGCENGIASFNGKNIGYSIISYPYIVVKSEESPAGGGIEKRIYGESSVMEENTISGTLVVSGNGTFTSIRVNPVTQIPLGLAAASGFSLTSPIDLEARFGRSEGEVPDAQVRRASYPPSAGWFAFEGQPNIHTAIDGTVFITGSTIQIPTPDGSRSIETGRFETGEEIPWPDGSSARQYELRIALVQLGPSTMEVQAGGEGRWQWGADRVGAALAGDMRWVDAWGNGTIGHQSIPHAPALLEFRGEFHCHAEIEGGTWTWDVHGSASEVWTDGILVWSGPKAAMVAASVVAVVLLWKCFLGLWRGGLFLSGVTRAHPLQGPRVKILLKISEEPGVTRRQLAVNLGMSRASVIHHLNILHSAAIIEQVGDGKIPGYVLNSGTTRFALPADEMAPPIPPRAHKAYAIIRHPIRDQIRTVLDAWGPCRVTDIRDHWPADIKTPSAQTLGYHLKKMAEASIVFQEDRPGFTRWALSFEPTEHDEHRRKAFLLANNLQGIVRLAGTRDAWVKSDLESLVRSHLSNVSARARRNVVCFLIGVGALIEQSPGILRPVEAWVRAAD